MSLSRAAVELEGTEKGVEGVFQSACERVGDGTIQSSAGQPANKVVVERGDRADEIGRDQILGGGEVPGEDAILHGRADAWVVKGRNRAAVAGGIAGERAMPKRELVIIH